MCHKHSSESIKLAKLTVLLLFFFFAECAAGSCLSYGHACWGAHGKRNGLNIPQQLPQNRGGEIPDSRWFMSRLVQAPLEERFDRNMETPPNHDRSFEPQFFSDAQSELDPLKMQDEYRIMQENMANDDNSAFLDNLYERQHQRMDGRQLKGTKFLDKRSAKVI